MVTGLLCFWVCEAGQRVFMVEKKQGKGHIGRDQGRDTVTKDMSPLTYCPLVNPTPGNTTILQICHEMDQVRLLKT